MSLKIYSAENLPKETWSHLTDNSFLSSPEFAQVWRTMRGREVFLAEEDDRGIRAGMAGVVFGTKYLRRYHSMPDGTSGGPFFRTDLNQEAKDEFIQSVIVWLKSEGIIRADVNNPLSEISTRTFRRRQAETHVITLSDESYRPPDSGIRKHIRTGIRRQGQIASLDDPKYLEEFYRLVILTERRHGQTPRFPLDFFKGLQRISATDDRILWLMVLADDKMIGSRICFIESSQLILWQYYSDKSFGHYKPGYLMLNHIIDFARQNNIRTINMGWSPPDAEALVDFKERWGGEKHLFHYYTYFSRLGRLIYRWREK